MKRKNVKVGVAVQPKASYHEMYPHLPKHSTIKRVVEGLVYLDNEPSNTCYTLEYFAGNYKRTKEQTVCTIASS